MASAIITQPAFLRDSAPIRERIESTIEWLIGLLDSADPDPDLEPYLAGAPREFLGFALDGEVECEDEGAQCDDEGVPADNGLADGDGFAEQYGHRGAYPAYVI